jgi:acetyltransferase-like isoleucine patch superfamily enzyme
VLGARLSLVSGSAGKALGVCHPVVRRALTATARLTIGHDCGLSATSIWAAVSVPTGDDVFIGTGAIVTNGVTLGDNATVAAGGVVMSDVPPRSIGGGNLARLLKQIP